jgi:hypothetical protein
MIIKSVETDIRNIIMNVRGRRVAHRTERAITRGIFVLGSATTFALWYALSSINELEAILVSATLLSTVVLCVILYTRIKARQRWQAAWELYANVDLSENSFDSAEEARTFSLAGTN